ncbi:MAG: FAD-binding oxidoreductase [Chromatiales bacterium]|nr:FAD-binding oxidoreductase [Chromatiales bacterium]
MRRRDFLGTAGLALAAPLPLALPAPVQADGCAPPPPLAPIRASVDRIIAINVCSRPFRAAGPRIEAERLGRKTVVHNYGHGGAGWSLSWGSAARALELVKATGERDVAVIGCGAIGLTTAVTAQRAGLRVRIHARERPPEVSSSWATGVWTPDSRLCTAAAATPDFERQWEAMARTSFRTWQTLLGLPGSPVEWHDGYALSDVPFGPGAAGKHEGEPGYAVLESRLLGDLRPVSRQLAPGEHPFAAAHAARYTMLGFNIGPLCRLLMDDFLQNGGELETRSFESPRQFADLREKVLVNATGYGARQLLGDESIVPIRGQTTRLIPQPEVTYGLYHLQKNVFVAPRRDGILVQSQEPGDFGNPDTTPDRAASAAAVRRLAALLPQG